MNDNERELFRATFEAVSAAVENSLGIPRKDLRARQIASRATDAALEEFKATEPKPAVMVTGEGYISRGKGDDVDHECG